MVLTPDPFDRITACITEFNRPESLKRLLASLESRFPSLRVEVQPTGGNLSWGRNRLVERCQTPYYLMLEEDYVLDSRTDLIALLDVMDGDAELAGVSAITAEPKTPGTINRGGTYSWAREFQRIRDKSYHHASRSEYRRSPAGVQYRPCELTLNFGLFRTEALREIPWDEKIEVGCEIIDWFWRFYLDARWRFGLVETVMVVHLRDRPGPEYTQPRNRSYRPYLAEKHGVEFMGRAAKPEERELPNVVYLTVGRSNSTINMRMLVKAFGFEVGDVDRRFMEHKALREENRRLWNHGGPIDAVAAKRALRSIPEPWAIKEPCWCRTLGHWLPLFERYSPALLYITKDRAVVKDSMKRAGWSVLKDRAFDRCERFYREWEGPKLRGTAEGIAAGIKLFDHSRMKQPY